MRKTLSWPTLSRLVHKNDEPRVHALRRWATLVCPDRVPEASNDNDLPIDTRHGIRPGEGEIMRAIGSEATGKAWSETCRQPMPTYTPPTARLTHPGPDAQENARQFPGGANARLGDLLFRDGELVSYGTPTGRTFKPGERYGAAKGAGTQKRSEASVRKYLALRGAVAEPGGLRRPMSGAPTNAGQKDWNESFDAASWRYLLAFMGVSRHFTFDQARKSAGLPESDRGPDFIGSGEIWTGGISHARGRGECSTGAPRMREAENLDRRIELAQLRDQLGHHAIVLDMAVSPASAEQIALARGYSPSSAKKLGAALVDNAIDALIALDAENHNFCEKVAA